MKNPTGTECPKRTSMDEIILDIVKVDPTVYSKDLLNNSDYRLTPNDEEMKSLYLVQKSVPSFVQPYRVKLSEWEFAIRYRSAWKKILEIEVPKGTNAGDSQEKRYRTGMSKSEATTFGYEIGLSVTGEAGDGLFTKISATISSSFSESHTFETSIYKEEEDGYKPLSFEALEDCILTMWQLQSRYHIVSRKKGDSDWKQIHDEPYTLESKTIKWDIFPETAH